MTGETAGGANGELSIQERLYPGLPCFGCGHERGLRLRSYPTATRERALSGETASGETGPGETASRRRSSGEPAWHDTGSMVTAQFLPWPEHDNGLGYLNGGIIATLLDCHSAAAVMLEAERLGWPALPGAALPYVTAGLEVRYLRPSPLHEAVTLRAVVTSAGEAEMVAEVELIWQGKTRASATAHWKRWRPR